MSRLAAFVHVADDQHGPAVFGPDDDVPAWAEKLIVNPKAWADAPDPQPADNGDGGWDSKTVDELKAEIATRNADREEADRVVVDGKGNKPDLVEALTADDAKLAAAGGE